MALGEYMTICDLPMRDEPWKEIMLGKKHNMMI